ncbi:MAG: gephyrin-like molybdotransferase Glp [Anaerolineae bacterium]
MTDRRQYPVLSVEEARERILAFVAPTEKQSLPILQALGTTLYVDQVAETSIPPHNNSAMDGYAIRHVDLAADGETMLRVVGQVPAGSVWPGTLGAGEAVRIMTGAPMPAGADTVVRFEDARAEGSSVHLTRRPRQGADVRLAGEDVAPGQIVLRAGTRLGPAEIGMLASLGRPTVEVHRRPRVAILATGDEVAAIDEPLQPGKIRNINSYTNAAQAARAGAEPLVLEAAPDRREALQARLRQALDLRADLIITSGGVSVGDFDLVKQVLSSEGSLEFWWVNMKPGRPLAFGTLGGIPLLALAGNPVAAMLGMLLFGVPAIEHAAGLTRQPTVKLRARLAEPITHKDGRRHYLRVRLAPGADEPLARLTGDQGSGILTSMVEADALAIIPESVDHLEAGSLVEVIPLR